MSTPINQVGLCDVVGGRMWFCCTNSGGIFTTSYFWTKRELEQHIRHDGFTTERKRVLLRLLRDAHGRAYAYAR